MNIMKGLLLTLFLALCIQSIAENKKLYRPLASKQKHPPEIKLSLDILNKEPVGSARYKQQSVSLFSSAQTQASFNTLELLANLYASKKDSKNQIKILKIATSNYEDVPRGHFLLGSVYKKLYFENNNHEHLTSAIESFYKAIQEAHKKRYKYEQAHIQLLPLLKIYSQSSYLELVQNMVTQFKKPEYDSELCEAYFKNRLLRQSRVSCEKAIQTNPNDPRGKYFLILGSKNKNQKDKEFIRLAKKFPNSHFIQMKVGENFARKDFVRAVKYLKKANKLKPKSAETHKNLGWALFNLEKEEEAYTHLYQACVLKPNLFLKDLQLAKMRFQNKTKNDTKTRLSLMRKFKAGVKDCSKKLK